MVEYAGVVVLVAAILVALLPLRLGDRIGHGMERLVTCVLSGHACTAGAPRGATGAGPGGAVSSASSIGVLPGAPTAAHTPGPGSLPPGKKPGIGFGHCGPDDYVPGAVEAVTTDYIGGVYIGDLCNWHDHCTAWTAYLKDGYNCNMLLRQAMHARCDQAPKWVSWDCNIQAEVYFDLVEEAKQTGARPGSMPNHGPPPPQVGYPPGVHH